MVNKYITQLVDYAEKYYRGNPLVESLGLALGLTSEIIDKIFISGGNPDVITDKGGDGADAWMVF